MKDFIKMKVQKLAQKVLKYKSYTTFIFTDKRICYQWILFGKYKIFKTFKTL